MSKTKAVSKNIKDPQTDNGNKVELNNKKQKGTKKQLKCEDDGDVNVDAGVTDDQRDDKLENSNKDTEVRKKKLSKSEMYKEEQTETFDKLKILLDVKKNGTFTSEKVKKESKELTTVYLQKIKKFLNITDMS